MINDKIYIFMLFIFIILFSVLNLPAAIYTVTDTTDNQLTSLRLAITNANSNPGADEIHFNITEASGPPYRIPVYSAFPEITEEVIIDGTTQDGYVDAPVIILVNEFGLEINGFDISSGNCTIRGFDFQGFYYTLYLFNGGNNIIANNKIFGWHDGVRIENSSNNLIGGEYGVDGNYFGYLAECISILGNAASYNYIEGNIIGPVFDTGTNNHNGIYISNAPNNVIGGPLPANRNIISKNDQSGIFITGADASGNLIQGNHIGTDLAGDAALSNKQSGIYINDAPNNIIGGSLPGAGNLISGNESNGIVITGISASGNVVQGNFIGTNKDGTAVLGNRLVGIVINDAPNNTIGGQVEGTGNVISGNQDDGIYIGGANGDNNSIFRNYIGTDLTGSEPLGNEGNGISIREYVKDIAIGSENPEAGNIIAYNGRIGVFVDSLSVTPTTSRIAIQSNSIHSNGGLGIDLNSDGVTPNDPLDEDTGPNTLQNYPILTYAGTDTAVVIGTLNSRPGWIYRIEFFSNSSNDPSGHGEGETFLGFTTVITDAKGTAGFSKVFEGSFLPGTFITATATDSGSYNTSEFSRAVMTGVSSKVYGNNYIVNTTQSGIPLHWPAGTGDYMVSESVLSAYRPIIGDGFSAWSTTCPEIQYLNPGVTTTSSGVWGGDPDGLNNNVWFSSNWQSTGMDENVVSITRIRYNAVTGEMTDVDIAYNGENMAWSTSGEEGMMDVQNVATHEAGHFWGLGDLFNPGHVRYVQQMGDDNDTQTMFGFIDEGETQKRILNTGDIAGIAYLYSHLPEADIDLVLVFDGSDTYANTLAAFEPSKNSAIELIDKMHLGDRLAVIQLPNTEVLPLTEIVDNFTRDNLKETINAMDPGGTAAIGSGLQTAQNLLENNVTGANRRWEVILLSSGEETSAPWVAEVLPAIEASKTKIHTIGFEGGTSTATDGLSNIAAVTGGGYYHADNATQIGDIVNVIWYQILGLQLIYEQVNSTEDLGPGIRWQGSVVVDEGVATLLPGIRWQGSNLDLYLFDPNGREINHTVAATDPTIDLFTGPTYEYYRIQNPVAGTWILEVEGVDIPPPEQAEPYTVTVLALTDVTMDVSFDKDRYTSGEVMEITAKIYAGGEGIDDEHVTGGAAVTDATVQASVILPGTDDKSTLSLSHVGNGIYTGFFENTTIKGSYNFVITAEKTNGFKRQAYKTIYVVRTGSGFPPDAQVVAIKEAINNLDDSALKKPAANRKKTFSKKLDVILKLIISDNYVGAKDKLESDILVKLDGYYSGDPENDWITDQGAQNIIYPMVSRLIQDLELLHKSIFDNAKELIESPNKFAIFQNYPNPFNPSTSIKYQLAEDSEVILEIYDILGQVVTTLVNARQEIGYYQVQWDRKNNNGTSVSSGIYFYRFQAGDFSQVRKMILVQ